MPRPVDNTSSTGSPGIEKAVALIEKEAARRAAAARKAFAAGVKVARTEYDAKIRELKAIDREAAKDAERWRARAVAHIEGRPLSLADERSVKRENVVQASNGVSLPRLSCLERRS